MRKRLNENSKREPDDYEELLGKRLWDYFQLYHEVKTADIILCLGSIDMLPASPVSLMVTEPVVADTSNSVKSMAAAKPRMMLSPTLRALVISASETSKASVITPLALVARIRRPSAVVTAPVESRVASMPVDEEARIIPDPVPAFSMDMTEPEEVA